MHKKNLAAITPNPTSNPQHASSLPPRSSYQKKETAGPARREMGYKAMPRRNVLWALNNAEANGGTTSVPRMEAAPMIKFSGRQDVERLLK